MQRGLWKIFLVRWVQRRHSYSPGYAWICKSGENHFFSQFFSVMIKRWNIQNSHIPFYLETLATGFLPADKVQITDNNSQHVPKWCLWGWSKGKIVFFSQSPVCYLRWRNEKAKWWQLLWKKYQKQHGWNDMCYMKSTSILIRVTRSSSFTYLRLGR